MPPSCSIPTLGKLSLTYRGKIMNRILQQSHRIFVALALAAILVVQAAPVLSSFQIGNAGGWMTPLTECGGDTCG